MKDIVIKPLIELLLYVLGLVLFEDLNYVDSDHSFELLLMGFLASLRFRIMPQYEKNKKDKPQE